MIDFNEEYKKKLKTPEEAVQLIQSGDWIEYGQTASFAPACDKALAKRIDELEDIKIWCAIAPIIPEAVQADTEHKTFRSIAKLTSSLQKKLPVENNLQD